MIEKIDDKEMMMELSKITKNKGNWAIILDDVAYKLKEKHSVRVKAKVLWLLGEMGLAYPVRAKAYVKDIAGYLEDEHPKLRERAVNALGRIGRADKEMIIPYLNKIMETGEDDIAGVRLAFIWACENIATNAPELFCEKLDLFYRLISDREERVRREAPEMFRVMGKRKPRHVEPYMEKLQWFAENDADPVVRIHSAGAVRMTKKALEAIEKCPK